MSKEDITILDDKEILDIMKESSENAKEFMESFIKENNKRYDKIVNGS